MKRSVVVTGASTGVGRVTVRQLVAEGFHVWPTVRRQEDADELRAEFGERVEPLLLDLTDHDAVRAAGHRVREAGPLHGLVNNAGTVVAGPLEYVPIESFRDQLDVNLVGQLLMTQVMLPALRLAESPRIVMVGSIAGRVAGPMLGPYQVSKFGLVGLTDTLRVELGPAGIAVCLVELGIIRTPIWTRGVDQADQLGERMPPDADRYASLFEVTRTVASRARRSGTSPEVPAGRIVAALTEDRPRPRRTAGWDARLLAVATRFLPYRMLYRLTPTPSTTRLHRK
ncbi:MAG TPA: SDR family NAD(P)-dependent oxidoreductase [Actinopolymorphaceae bacterium]